MIEASGYEHAFLAFGLIQGGIVFVMSWLLLAPPPPIETAVVKSDQTAHGYTPMDVLQSPVFYVMYLMMVLVAFGGLSTLASMAPIAEQFKVGKIPVELFGMVLPALGFALFLNRIFDGIGRPLFWLAVRSNRS